MHKDEKKEPTLIQTACSNVAGFTELYEKFSKKITVAGRGQSTLKNYSHHLAKVALHFNCLPTQLDPDQLNDYLHVYLHNRGILLTPFHNMALMCPATTTDDVDTHTEVFGAAVAELVGG